MELSLAKLEQLYQKFGREFAVGSIVFMEDSCGDEMYLILDGEVEITKTYRELEYDKSTKLFAGTNMQTLGILRRGDFFGEMALLNDCPRSATARVVSPAKLICITRENFNLIIGSSNPIVLQILRSLSTRLREAGRYPRLMPRAVAAAIPATTAPVSKRPPKTAAPADAPVAAEETPRAQQSRVCQQCGQRLEREAKYCRECGTRVHFA